MHTGRIVGGLKTGVQAAMLVFWNENLVFLAVPKTGTSAIEVALAPHASACFMAPPRLKHIPAYRYHRVVAPMFRKLGAGEFETCAVLREPIDWLGSWYRYRGRAALDGHANSTAGLSFDAFARAYLAVKRPPFAEVGAQARFVSDASGRLAVTHLFAYEALPRLIGFLEHRLKVTIDLPKCNISPDRHLVLRPETEARLRRRLARDFALHDTVLNRQGDG